MGSGCSSHRVHAGADSAGEPPKDEAGSPWIFWEDEHGNPFYYNFRTGSYTGEQQQCDWEQFYDDDENLYWYNSATGESSWNGPCQPPEFPVLIYAVQNMIRQQMSSLPLVNASGGAPADAPVAMAYPVENVPAI